MTAHARADQPIVACLNSSEDVTQLLAEYLRLDGFRTTASVTPVRFGATPLLAALADLEPDVCVYTISIPYEDSWREFEVLRGAFPAMAFVLTTTNLRAFTNLVGADTSDAIELFGKPFDLAEVSRAVRRALGHPAADALLAARPGRLHQAHVS